MDLEGQSISPPPVSPRANAWFIPADGIAREVITADIQRYLGPDALVRPGFGIFPYKGVPGYWIHAYRTLTSQMIQDLKTDTLRWWKESSGTGPTTVAPIFYPSAFQIAEHCGWQVGLEKFLGEGQTGTPLTMTARGTLGRGSLGIVEEVYAIREQPMVQKRVHIPRRRESAQRYRKMVQDEIENLKHLEHQHIIKVLGCYEERRSINDAQICVLMWPPGDEDLSIFLEETYPNATYGSRMEYNIWLQSWLRCMASALTYMHSQRVHHEDVKPTNIIHRGYQIYFTDFSSSRKLQNEQDTSTSSPALATQLFAAPELSHDETGNAARHGSGTDVYSLGLVFFEVLCVLEGHTLNKIRSVLFANRTAIRQYHRVIHQAQSGIDIFRNPHQVWLFDSIVQHMLLRDRKQRPSALEVASRLHVTLHGVFSCSCTAPKVQ